MFDAKRLLEACNPPVATSRPPMILSCQSKRGRSSWHRSQIVSAKSWWFRELPLRCNRAIMIKQWLFGKRESHHSATKKLNFFLKRWSDYKVLGNFTCMQVRNSYSPVAHQTQAHPVKKFVAYFWMQPRPHFGRQCTCQVSKQIGEKSATPLLCQAPLGSSFPTA